MTGFAAEARAAECAHGHSAPAHARRADATHATVCLVNAVRRAHGLAGVRVNRRLSSAARDHSRDMVRRDYFAHNTPEGLTPALRVRRTGYLRAHGRWLVGETLAWWSGQASPRQIVTAWMHSTPHREVLLTPSFRDVGIGVVRGVPGHSRRGGSTYTADFGARWPTD